MTKIKSRRLVLSLLLVVLAFSLISFVMARPAKAETAVAKPVIIKETASVRTNEFQPGLRFTGFFDSSTGKELSTPENEEYKAGDTYVGILVAKGDKTIDEVKELAEATERDENLIIDIPAVEMDPSRDDGDLKAFNAVVYNIPEGFYNYNLTAVSYLVENGNYTYSDSWCIRSLAQVASSALKYDNPLGEDKEILLDFVDGVETTVSFGDTELLPVGDGETEVVNNIEIPYLFNTDVVVDPANITPIIAINNTTDFKMYGNSIVGATKGATAVMTISVGRTVYKVNLTVGTEDFCDYDLGENVIADFDEEGYKTLVTVGSGSFSVLTGSSATEVGAESGVLYKNFVDWDGGINFPALNTFTTTKYNDIYLKIKHPNVGKLVLILYDADGNALIERRLELLVEDGLTIDGSDFTTICLLGSKIVSVAGSNKEVASIKIYPGTGCAGEMYLDEIGVRQWKDESLAENVIVDFDEARYIDYITTGAGSATIDTESGVLNYALPDYGSLDIPVWNTFKLSSDVGIYLKIKADNLSKVAIDFKDAEGNRLSTNDYFILLSNFVVDASELNTTEWTTVYLLPSKLLNAANHFNNTTEIATISIGGWGVNPNNISIDEIGFGNWSATLAENVIADFDEIGYKNYISAGSILLGDNAVAEGADSGILKYTLTSYGKVEIFVQNPFVLNSQDKGHIYFKIKSSDFSKVRVGFKDVDGNWLSVDGSGTLYESCLGLSSYVFTGTDLTTAEWTTVYLDYNKLFNSSYKFKKDIEVGYVCFGILNYTADIWVDEIGFVKWTDDALAENVIADFDEFGYNFKITNSKSSFASILIGDSASAEGAESGILKHTLSNYDEIKISVQNPFVLNVEDRDYIYFKIKTDDFSNLRFGFRAADGTSLIKNAAGSTYDGCIGISDYLIDDTDTTTTEWTTIYLDYDKLFSSNFNFKKDVEVAYVCFAVLSSTVNICIDEIGFGAPEEPEEPEPNNIIVAGFDSASDAASITTASGGTASIITGADATALGAESGVLSYNVTSWGEVKFPVQYNFALGDESLGTLYLRVKATGLNSLRIGFFDTNDGSLALHNGSTYAAGCWPLSNFVVDGTDLESTEWITICIDNSKLFGDSAFRNDPSRLVGYIKLYESKGATVKGYIDEIGFIPPEVPEADPNVIAGFDLSSDASALIVGTTGSASIITGAAAEALGAESGVMQFDVSQWGSVKIPVANPFALGDETKGTIYIKVKATGLNYLRIGFMDENTDMGSLALNKGSTYKDSDGGAWPLSNFVVDGTNLESTEWITICIDNSKLFGDSAFRNNPDRKVAYIKLYALGYTVNGYIDEIGFIPPAN